MPRFSRKNSGDDKGSRCTDANLITSIPQLSSSKFTGYKDSNKIIRNKWKRRKIFKGQKQLCVLFVGVKAYFQDSHSYGTFICLHNSLFPFHSTIGYIGKDKNFCNVDGF